jgi:hypothetical protein
MGCMRLGFSNKGNLLAAACTENLSKNVPIDLLGIN